MKFCKSLLFFLAAAAYCNTPYIVGICGGSCSGKTTFAEKLRDLFGDQVAYISQDSYYKEFNDMTAEERREVNYDHPDAIDFDLLFSHLERLKSGGQITVPNYSFLNDRREPGGTKVNGKKIILIDGHLVFAIPKLRRLFDLKIFVDTDKDIRCIRRVVRDLSLKRDIANTANQYLENISPMYETFIAPMKSEADLVILGEKDNPVAIDVVSAKLKEHL
jgi:uridine kinase